MREYRPDRVVRVLTGLVSVAWYGMLVLTAVVLLGMPVAKLAAGRDSGNWSVGLPIPVTLLDAEATVVTRWGDGRLEVEDVSGTLRLPVAILPWWLVTVLWIHVATAASLLVMFLHHLRRIFQRVRDGAPFDAANAARLRWLGLLALGLALLDGVAGVVTSLAVRRGLAGEGMEVPAGLAVDGSLVFFGFVLLALAAIFRRGAELEEEQALTV